MHKYKGLVIRLQRVGCFKKPMFFIVVSFIAKRRSGNFIEKIGFLNLDPSNNFFFLNSFRLGFWLNKGALLNPSVCKFLSKLLKANII